ncbi:deoxyribodipyrimidine photo-lyase [Litorivicinus lipolyticus]|uniref:deoxyribodipyrimidine photo-lyase n=1 Tax=Litorivicinus lipolyticus TaxID=418701 RepID=UPI003B5CBFEC
MPHLVWLRRDLRVTDNPALSAACANTGDVITCVGLPDAQWQSHDLGAPARNLYQRRLTPLTADLCALNIPLLMLDGATFADQVNGLQALCERHGINAVYVNREYEFNERARDRAVDQALAARSIQVHWFDDQCLVPPQTLKTGQGGPYSVFTPYRRRWEASLREEFNAPLSAPARRPALTLAPARLTAPDDPLAALWPVDNDSIQTRLERFVARPLDRYQTDRDLPALEGTSSLSPYLAIGAISARQVLHAVLQAAPHALDGASDANTFVSELAWRDFYKNLLVEAPRVSRARPFKVTTETLPWNPPGEAFERWCQGQTGVPLVDAAMRQLNTTGWMHNRCRMVVAMFLTKNLFIDWRHGERYFMQRLVDADLAANNGGWQWSASTGTDAAPYFRIMNPVSQSQRFDKNGDYIRRWVPELADLDAKTIHAPFDAKAHPIGLKYPKPMVDLKRSRQQAIDTFKAHQQDSA